MQVEVGRRAASDPMKIRHVEAIHVSIPYEHGAPKPIFGIGTTRATMDAVYIRVDTDEGISGWGEAFGFAACPVTAAAVSRVVAPLAVGRDPGDIPALMNDIRRPSPKHGPQRAGGLCTVRL